MTTKQYKYVLSLATAGSFSRAAEALNISQPSLSQYIKKLEQQLGVELFDRTNGDVRLTDAGRVFVDAGRQMLALEHQMETQLSDIAAYKTGTLIVGAAPYRAAGMMPLIAKKFQQLYPGVSLVVREGTTAELLEGMEHGEFDLCLTLRPEENELLCVEKVMEEELVLAVPGEHAPLAAAPAGDRKYPAIDVGQVNDLPLVMLTDTQYMQKQLETVAKRSHLHLRTAAVVKSLGAQIAMVRAGVGAALMPSGIDRFCPAGEVAFYSFIQPLPRREVVVLWRRNRPLSQVAEELKKIILNIDW